MLNETIFGFHAIETRLKRDAASLLAVRLDAKRKDARAKKLAAALQQAKVPLEWVDKAALGRLVGKVNHQGVVAEIRPRTQQGEQALWALLETLAHPGLLLVLDQVTDPHNLGACLRSANGAGVDAVILPKDGACAVNDTVSRVASGAAELTPVFYVSNLARTLNTLKDKQYWLTGLGDRAEQSVYEAELTGACVLVLGAEGAGLRRLTAETCDQLVSLPMAGEVSSLNVSVATGIALYEAVRQRKAHMNG